MEQKYFARIHAQSSAAYEAVFYYVFDENQVNYQITKEILFENNSFKDFSSDKKNKKKDIYIDYSVYYTTTNINNATKNETFESLINSTATFFSQGEISIKANEKNKPITPKKNRKKKKNPVFYLLGGLGAIAVCFIAFALGTKFSPNSNVTKTVAQTEVHEDGMLIPIQQDISNDAEQITVSIDRSYSSVPTEDLQLKGEIKDGVAEITLPEFDKSDFFTHVEGYTWGFTSNPDGKKIEYYGGTTYKFKNDIKLYRVLVKYGGGSGTKDDPYLIDYFDQLAKISEDPQGYFKQTEDIVFPEYAKHTPIDIKHKLTKEPDTYYFEYDGNGHTISNLSSPLFGEVSGAYIHNVNIKNSHISSPDYKDIGFIACNVLNYSYTAEDKTEYTTGNTIIKHCSVFSSSIYNEYTDTLAIEEDEEATTENEVEVIAPDVIEYDENGKVIEKKEEEKEPTKTAEHCIGAITGIGGQIEDCYVSDFQIECNLDDYILYVGGISGKPINVINSCVYNFSTEGKIFNVGGIAGSCGGSRLYDTLGKELPDFFGGNIFGCVARNIALKSEVAVGGIAGEGSTNVKGSAISNCYCMSTEFDCGVYDKENKLIKSGSCGGIIGIDGKEKYGHKITNTVSPSDFNVIGARTLSNYDDTVRLAPEYAYYQNNILLVINKNAVNTDEPDEINEGIFIFSTADVFGNEDNGSLPYPSSIDDLIQLTNTEEENSNE